MRKLILFLIILSVQVPVFGQHKGRGRIIPYDSTAYYQRLFADDSEFDIRKFTPLPVYHNRWAIIDGIKPVPGYHYWECRYLLDMVRIGVPGELVVYNGDQAYSAIAGLKAPDHGFFDESHHSIRFSYIVAVGGNFNEDEDLTVDIIDSDAKLIEFMGAVDNIEEVICHIRANGYWYHPNKLITGAYREESDRYLLYLYRRSKEEPRSDESVKAILYKTGKFEVVSSVVYETSDILIWP